MVFRLVHHSTRKLLQILRACPGAGGVLVRPGDRGIHLTSQVIRPAASASACSPVMIAAHTPARCQRRNNPYTARQEP